MSLATLTTEIRHAVGDTGLLRTHIVLVGLLNGINKRFQTSLHPLSSDAVLYTGAGVEVESGYTFDADTGMVVFTVAPSPGDQYFFEGIVQRFKATDMQYALARAARGLYGVWGATKYVVSGTGATLALTPEPTGHDLQLLVVVSALYLATSTRFEASASSVRLSDSTGAMDITTRGTLLGELVTSLREDLNQLIADSGYSLPRFPSTDFPLDFQGQVWTEARNTIAL